MKGHVFKMPFPPSVNTYWRRNGSRYFIAKAGKAFRKNATAEIIKHHGGVWTQRSLSGPLAAVVHLHPPDARQRDIDNYLKAPLDVLQHLEVYYNDHQIQRLTVEKYPPVGRPGWCEVQLLELDSQA